MLLHVCQWQHTRGSAGGVHILRSVAGRSAKLSKFEIDGKEGLKPSSDVGEPEG